MQNPVGTEKHSPGGDSSLHEGGVGKGTGLPMALEGKQENRGTSITNRP